MPSSSNFPTSLDTFSDPTSTTRTDTGIPHGALHALENDAIASLETKVGIDSSTDHASIDWKLGDARSRLTTAESAIATKADLVSGKVPSSQLPSYVDDVLEYANLAAFPGTGETGKIYIADDTNTQYRWSGSAYIEIVASPGTTDAITEGTTNLFFTPARVLAVVLTGLSLATNAAITATDTVLSALGKLQKQITDLIATVSGKVDTTTTVNGHALSGNVTVTKSDVGLGNVDNTSDVNKPVSTLQAAADAAVASAAATDATTKASAALASAQAYTDTAVTGLLDFKGATSCSGNPNYPAASKGDAYVASSAGKIGGASGTAVDVGDVFVASADNAGGTQASVGSSWFILEHNLGGALLSANNLSDLANAATARGNLGLATVAASGSAADLTGTLAAARLPSTAQLTYYGTAAGTNTYTITFTPAVSSFVTGTTYTVNFTNANTGASTLGGTAIQLKGAALVSGDIQANVMLDLVFDGTNLQIIGAAGSSGGSTSPFTIRAITALRAF